MADAPSCARSSREIDEPVWGTANDTVRRWLLLEHHGRWGSKIPRDTEGLSDPVRGLLGDPTTAFGPGTRVQFIRRPQQLSGDGPRRVFVVEPERQGGRVMTRMVEGLDALVDDGWGRTALDDQWAAAARGDGLWELYRAPLLLVCAHGARDACCARHGVGLYLALEDARDRAALGHGVEGGGASPTLPEVWQTSHLGGHRFAAVALSLPDGHVYGRVRPAQATALLAGVATKRLFSLEHVRGSSRRNPAEQVAELHVRNMLDRRDFDGICATDHVCKNDGDTVRVQVGERCYEVHLTRRATPLQVLGSCGDTSPKSRLPYELRDIRQLDPG